MARKRGRPKLQDISYIAPSFHERRLIPDKAWEGDPIVTAILGASMIEIELDTLLRARFPKITDDVWASMVRENGPFSTLDQKITAAFAFRIIDEATKDNLKIIKNIRNAFAHAKTIIGFDHKLVIAELHRVKVPKFQKKIHRQTQKTAAAKQSYVLLCMAISSHLMGKITASLKGKTKRLKRKMESPFTAALIQSAYPNLTSGLGNPKSTPHNQGGDPNFPAPQGLLAGLANLGIANPRKEEK